MVFYLSFFLVFAFFIYSLCHRLHFHNSKSQSKSELFATTGIIINPKKKNLK